MSSLNNEIKKEEDVQEKNDPSIKEEDDKGSKTEEKPLSYQEMAIKRKKQHLAFLENILDWKKVKQEASAYVPPSKASPASNTARRFPPKKRKVEPLPQRKSLRLQNMPASEKVADYSIETKVEQVPKKKRICGAVSFTVAAQETGDQLPESFVESVQFLKDAKPVSNLQTKSLSDYVKKFEKMKIQDSLVAKVAYSRIYCVAAHPSSEKILFASGSRDGEVSFWDLDSRNERLPFLFVPHSGRVTCLNFSPYNLCEMYTSSYDGSMRCGDLVKGVFDKIFQAEDDEYDVTCTSFDFLSSSTFLVSLRSGMVTLVDKRTKNLQGEKDLQVQECITKTVSVHPTNKDYFVVAGGNGVASIWDLRNTNQKPVIELSHQRSLNSAYFSPVTGNYILTTSLDDKLRVFENPTLKSGVKLKTSIRHNNHTGRWLAPLRAVWLPDCEDGFVVGCMEQPRRIEVFGTDGKIAHIFSGDSLASVCSVNAIHPSRPALAGANSSGKLHVFLST